MTKIFISYAREDAREIALKLRDDLQAAGHTVWLDTSDIAAGASWSREIELAIEDCTMILALLSTASYVSEICRAEQLRGLRKNKRVIPILLEPDVDRPLYLENLNYFDFSNMAYYIEHLADLLHFIETGEMPTSLVDMGGEMRPIFPPKERTDVMPAVNITPTGHKRDARAFRRYIADLRAEPWLADRYWWTYYLFYFADVHEIVKLLIDNTLKPAREKPTPNSWDHLVRLYFRPRTPDLFRQEGIRPEDQLPDNHCPIPVYLLFDLEAVITLAEARFSEASLMTTKKTYSSASSFRDLPFHLIYHDKWLKLEERDEVLAARHAQVILPHELDLTRYVRHIWCRSTAEYETLYYLLPEEARLQWGDKITARTDYELFNRRWAYVEKTVLSAEGALFTFNQRPEFKKEDLGIFDVRAELIIKDTLHPIHLGEMSIERDVALDFSTYDTASGYTLRLYLDNTLAYAGQLYVR
ncbi:MAG: hypothetical protein CUN56_01795 [Phototrophicales bacterium]|nr:MAG: hypothetical protein CUN56_01795 [Phototrophicales bacterium]RMG69943.1 MAG: DUF4433 domain-containing protein [Chloroflexota bacterium]